jgi:hypothetical protein
VARACGVAPCLLALTCGRIQPLALCYSVINCHGQSVHDANSTHGLNVQTLQSCNAVKRNVSMYRVLGMHDPVACTVASLSDVSGGAVDAQGLSSSCRPAVTLLQIWSVLLRARSNGPKHDVEIVEKHTTRAALSVLHSSCPTVSAVSFYRDRGKGPDRCVSELENIFWSKKALLVQRLEERASPRPANHGPRASSRLPAAAAPHLRAADDNN